MEDGDGGSQERPGCRDMALNGPAAGRGELGAAFLFQGASQGLSRGEGAFQNMAAHPCCSSLLSRAGTLPRGKTLHPPRDGQVNVLKYGCSFPVQLLQALV